METLLINPLKIAASRICLGTWAIGGWLWGGTDEQDSIKTIHEAFAQGITMIDTAPVYGFGLAEEIVGKALAQYGKREEIIIATKAGLAWDNGKVTRNSTPQRIEQEINDSLRRLGTDYIDIYQIHWPDPLVPFAETAATMLKLLKQGKIRAIGVSNYSPQQMQEFMAVAPIHTSQPPYNLFERQIEQEILPFTEQQGITTLAYGSLCRGLLAGKMTLNTQFKGDDLRQNDPLFQPPHFQSYLAAVDALDQFARKHYGKNVLALAVRWVLDQGRTIALWGARRPEQLQTINEVMGWQLDSSAMQEIEKILQVTLKHPVYERSLSPATRAEQ